MMICVQIQVREEFGAALGRAVARFYKKYYEASKQLRKIKHLDL